MWAPRTHVPLFTTVQVWSSVQHINKQNWLKKPSNPHKLRHFWKNPVKLWKSREEIGLFVAKQKPFFCFSTCFYPRWIPAHNQLSAGAQQSNFGELCVPLKKSWLRPWSVNLLLLIFTILVSVYKIKLWFLLLQQIRVFVGRNKTLIKRLTWCCLCGRSSYAGESFQTRAMLD